MPYTAHLCNNYAILFFTNKTNNIIYLVWLGLTTS